MTTTRATVDFILEQVAEAGVVTAKPMFGEYGLFCDGRMVAILGDDQLFLKRTSGGKVMAPEATEVSPYPGAKPCLLIDADRWDDAEWLTELVRATARELPLPKPRPPRRR